MSRPKLSLSDICAELGLEPQFLHNLSLLASTQYSTYDRPKRSGGVRTIAAPQDRLKSVQRLILDQFLTKVALPGYVHGCVKGRSMVTNASGHVNKPLVLNIDLTDFFGSISFERVIRLYKEVFDCDDSAAETLTRLTTYGNFLPQGAPTSPMLANFAALELDYDLIAICEKNAREYQFHYSRYVDDITISGDAEIAFCLGEFYLAISRHGFKANSRKLKIARPSMQQKVTGIVVNQKLNPPKKLVRRIRQSIYYCTKFGLVEHCQRAEIDPDLFWSQIKGLIGYVRMTRPLLADELEVALYRAVAVPPGAPSGDLNLMLALRHMVNEELIATFIYEDTAYRVAPAEVYVDEEGVKNMRGFVLSPRQGWQTFYVSSIQFLAAEENKS